MRELIHQYLQTKERAWTPATLKSETSRLLKIERVIPEGPDALWEYLQNVKPYTRQTSFVRVTAFIDWVVARGHLPQNLFKQWKQENARLFKNNYEKKTPEISYSEAEAKINSLSNEAVRTKALQLLRGGLRWAESFTISNGYCLGKGEKRRRVYVEAVAFPYSYALFVKELRKAGLKPHDLRKIRASDLAAKGLREADLCAIFGWNSFATASSYLAPRKENELQEVMNG